MAEKKKKKGGSTNNREAEEGMHDTIVIRMYYCITTTTRASFNTTTLRSTRGTGCFLDSMYLPGTSIYSYSYDEGRVICYLVTCHLTSVFLQWYV